MSTAVHGHRPDEFRILHLSDVHATVHGDLHTKIDGAQRLILAAARAVRLDFAPQAVVITGDLIERGHAAAYPDVVAALAQVSETIGAAVLTVLGNHDNAAAALILPGHERGHDRVETVGEIRFVLLDSSARELGGERLVWLRNQLSEPYGRGTIVALHHPPIASPLTLLQGQELRDADAFLDALAGSDVLAVLAGHFHHQFTAIRRGIPIFVGPSLAYHQLMAPEPGTLSGVDRPLISLLRITEDGVAQHSAALIPPDPLFTIRTDQTPTPAPNRK